MKKQISLSHDTVNWLALILEEDEYSAYTYMKLSLSRMKELNIGHNVLFRTVLDEIREILSMKWGMLRKVIETEIQKITKNSESISIHQFSNLIDLLEKDIIDILPNNQRNQYLFIRKNVWKITNPKTDYLKLNKKSNRAKFYAETKEIIMLAVDIESFRNLCKSMILVYDAIDKISDAIHDHNDYLEIVDLLVKGSRNSRGSNLKDKMHLLSCFFYSQDYINEALLFCTTDKPMVKNYPNQPLPFTIIHLKKINSYLLNASQ